MIKITFFGVRGSTPCAGPDYIHYGGHTSCIAIELDDWLVILDAGSGIADASHLALSNPHKQILLLFSHVHLDHIMGLPFFAPVWKKDMTINIMAGSLEPYGGIHHFLNNTFTPPLFPIKFSNFAANIQCHDFKAGNTLEPFPNLKIDTCALNHPNGAVGYRLNYKGKSVCYITDTEHSLEKPDHSILNLIKSSDLVIYDSSYDDNNFSTYKGWGHSTWQEGVRLAKKANAKKLAIFHHDPRNTDDKMEIIEKSATQEWDGTFVAKQAETVVLE
jgi:phosphoribosyl 1,2-cyclic phosphodiesterase